MAGRNLSGLLSASRLLPSPILFLFPLPDFIDFGVEYLFFDSQQQAAIFQEDTAHNSIGNYSYRSDNIADQLAPFNGIMLSI